MRRIEPSERQAAWLLLEKESALSQEREADSRAKSARQGPQPPAERDTDVRTQEHAPTPEAGRAPADSRSLSPRNVLWLQSRLGNQATGALVSATAQRLAEDDVQMAPASVVQRDGEDPLDAEQVRKAIGFYRNRRAQYTEEIIRQIQAGVGVPETGTVDAAMVQAVARYQQTHSPLKVDGMAGPRTLPALFPSGLAEEEEVETFAEAARGVIEGDWASQTVEERADALIERVNERLDEAGVPQVTRVIQDLGGDAGRFAFSLWAIRLDRGTLESETLTDAQAADLADTVYHEARHAEQWYRIAQMLAGQGRTAEQIATEMGIPNEQAAEAVDAPLAPGSMEALIADGWYQSIYGRGSAHRERVLGPEGTFEEYQDLPEESDAWRVGGAVTEAYTREEEEESGE